MHGDDVMMSDMLAQAARPAARVGLNAQLRELAETDAPLAARLVHDLLPHLPLADRQSRARAIATLGVAQVKAGDYATAHRTLLDALELVRDGDEHTRADIFGHLACTGIYLGQFESGLAYGLESLRLARAAGAKLQQAFALHNIGQVYDNFGLNQEALESFLAELALLDEMEVAGVRRALALNGAGLSYSRLHEFSKAMTYLESALAIARQQDDVRAQALTLSNLGYVVHDRRELERALRYYQESLALYESLADPFELARLEISQGEAYHQLNRLPEALAAFNRALEHLGQAGSATLAIEAHLNLSYLRYQLLEPAAALEHLYAARALTDEDAAPADAFRVHRALAEALKMQGEFRRALAHFETFHALKERVQREAEVRKAKGLLLQFDTEHLQHEREMYRLKHVELARAYSQLEALSVRDPLTNLHNRRYLTQQLAREVTRAQRYRRPLCVMFCDIDDFKKVNDTFSHAVGDEVLKVVADILMTRTRSSDIRARLGGEEMVVVFSETSEEDALLICKDILAVVNAHDWEKLYPGLRVTVSIGLAALQDGDTPERLLARADERMYAAKAAGKNRIVAQDGA